MKKHILFTMLTQISLIIISYIVILSVFVKTPEDFRLPAFLIVPIIIVSAIIGVKYIIAFTRLLKSKTSFLVSLGILALIPRLVWVLFVNTKPVSDFVLYNNYAINASNGIFNAYHHTYSLFPFKFGYPVVLSLAYRLLGSNSFSAVILNIVFSVLTAYSIYWLGKMLFTETSGRVSAILFALWPAQIMYSSVLASEHIFIIFFILSIGMLIKATQSTSIKAKVWYPIASGFLLGITNQIRPISLLLIPAFFMFIFLFTEYKKLCKEEFIEKSKTLVLLLGSYSFFFILVSLPLSHLIGVDVWKASAGYNIMVGTNYESNGTYSSQVENSLAPYKNDYDTFHSVAAKIGFGRIVESPITFISLLEKKVIIMWGNEEYGYFWSTNALTNTNSFSDMAQTNPRALKLISQIFYINILILAILGCISAKKNKIRATSALLVIFVGLFLSYSILEVQSRYHFPAMPLLMVFSGYGIISVKKLLPLNISRYFMEEKKSHISNFRHLHSVPKEPFIVEKPQIPQTSKSNKKILEETLKS